MCPLDDRLRLPQAIVRVSGDVELALPRKLVELCATLVVC
jgi:hypothetical protein